MHPSVTKNKQVHSAVLYSVLVKRNKLEAMFVGVLFSSGVFIAFDCQLKIEYHNQTHRCELPKCFEEY